MVIRLATICVWLMIAALATADSSERGDEAARHLIEVDARETPELQPWAQRAGEVMTAWLPRIVNLLASRETVIPRRVTLRLRRADHGLASTSGSTVTVYSHWVEKHPEDIGVVVHELVHVVQRYPAPQPGWVTEGIADYVRWAIFEGRPLERFPCPQTPAGYRQGYQVTAGFLLWLESDLAPGIVRQLNAAMRRRQYADEIFRRLSGRTIDDLWRQYVRQRRPDSAP